MTDIDLDELIRILPQLIRENDTVKGAIITALSGVMATHEDIERIIAINHEDIERIIAINHEELIDLNAKMDERFAAQHQEIVGLNGKMDNLETKTVQGFNALTHTLQQIQSEIGKPFEQFARNVVVRILEGEGMTGVQLKKDEHVPDPDFIVSESSPEFEVDGLSEDPPIIVEITSILRDQAKIERFLKKKHYLEDIHQVQYRGFFVASGSELSQEDKAEILLLLHQNNCELINL